MCRVLHCNARTKLIESCVTQELIEFKKKEGNMSHSPSYVTFHIGPIFCSSGIMYSTNLSGSWNVQEIGFHFHNMENTSLSKKKKKKRENKNAWNLTIML